ncbi:MAG TPA: magnesium transporter CorA family protein [Streptosporangiaceae bacterium]
MSRFLMSLDCAAAATADRQSIEHMLAGGQLLWLEFCGVDDQAVALLREVCKLHPVAVAEAGNFGQRPRIEDFDGVAHLVSYGAAGLGEPLTEVHCYYSERFLVTVTKGACPQLAALREKLTRPGGRLPGGVRPTRLILLHHIQDTLIDSFFPVLSEFDDKIDDLQERIFARPSNDELQELFTLQRWLVGARKLVAPQRDMMASLAAGVTDLPGLPADGQPYVRDLYDHLIRINDLIDSYRDLLSNAMDVYLSTMSNRLNEVMKQLAVIATVFLPLSFLTGFFGQNFSWLVGHLNGVPAFLALGVGTEALAVAGLYLMFRRRGWL